VVTGRTDQEKRHVERQPNVYAALAAAAGKAAQSGFESFDMMGLGVALTLSDLPCISIQLKPRHPSSSSRDLNSHFLDRRLGNGALPSFLPVLTPQRARQKC
jgi:hypothetical protein